MRTSVLKQAASLDQIPPNNSTRHYDLPHQSPLSLRKSSNREDGIVRLIGETQ